jgi:hypothetical protein
LISNTTNLKTTEKNETADHNKESIQKENENLTEQALENEYPVQISSSTPNDRYQNNQLNLNSMPNNMVLNNNSPLNLNLNQVIEIFDEIFLILILIFLKFNNN